MRWTMLRIKIYLPGIGMRHDEDEDIADTDDDNDNQPDNPSLVKKQRTHKAAGTELVEFVCFLLTRDIF